MIKTIFLRSQFHIPLSRHTKPTISPANRPYLIPTVNSSSSNLKHPYSPLKRSPTLLQEIPAKSPRKELYEQSNNNEPPNGHPRNVILGVLTVGIVLFVAGFDDEHGKALALGPEGPLMEDFWDNMRRYGLYALTVSTGVAYAVFQPILELLKNPISAILILTIIGGGIFIVSQVVTAMVGASDFAYEYAY